MSPLARKMAILFVAFILALVSVTGIVTPAAAAPGNILPPFDLGQTWRICQGYDNPDVTHHDNGPYATNPRSRYGLDLITGNGCSSTAAGKTVRAPVSGTIQGNPSASSAGSMCINMPDGRSLTLTHINTSITGGSVNAGDAVGTVAAAWERSNGGVPHIHLQPWSSHGCWATGNGGIPFDSAHSARICGAGDLTASGPVGTGNGTWSGELIVGSGCDAVNSPRQWHLRDWNTDGPASTAFSYASFPSDHPVAGDWDGDGTFTPGVVRNEGGQWWWHLRNYNSDGGVSIAFAFGSVATDNPIVGDWDGNGTVTPGITRVVNGELQWHLKNVNDGGGVSAAFNYGASTDRPVVGDWDGTGTMTPGIVRNVGGEWQWHLRNDNSAGGAHASFNYGSVASDKTVVGDWNGDGIMTPGVVRSPFGTWQWHLRNENSAGAAQIAFSYGSGSTDVPITGDWDGNGIFTPGVTRAG